MRPSVGAVTDLVPLPAQPDGVAWPTVEWPTGEAPVADPARLDALVDHAFEDPAPDELGHTHALLVVHRGVLVVERYGQRFVTPLHELAGIEHGPITAEDVHISWSMAKSVIHSTVGTLLLDGAADLHDRPPVPEWDEPGDPRQAITWDHLLQMRPGLAWVEEYYEDKIAPGTVPDVLTMLYTDARHDMAAFAASFPLVTEPGSSAAYNYSSGTSNLVARAAGTVVGGGEDGMRSYLDRRVFAPLGITSADPTFDRAGTFLASSYLNATARDYARFGLWNLRDGVWDGERLLPEGWVDHGRQPRSIDDNFIHGAHWWTTKVPRWGMFLADGFEGQRIYCVPELDVVVVRLGVTHTSQSPTMDAHLQEIIACFAD